MQAANKWQDTAVIIPNEETNDCLLASYSLYNREIDLSSNSTRKEWESTRIFPIIANIFPGRKRVTIPVIIPLCDSIYGT